MRLFYIAASLLRWIPARIMGPLGLALIGLGIIVGTIFWLLVMLSAAGAIHAPANPAVLLGAGLIIVISLTVAGNVVWQAGRIRTQSEHSDDQAPPEGRSEPTDLLQRRSVGLMGIGALVSFGGVVTLGLAASDRVRFLASATLFSGASVTLYGLKWFESRKRGKAVFVLGKRVPINLVLAVGMALALANLLIAVALP
jgi:hypothetical protein